MESELVSVFNEDGKPAGTSTREEAHKNGYWHETFQCWVMGNENGTDYIYFQLRSSSKKDFPNLLDITAAGHILANETVEDGVREVQEELGIKVAIHDLLPLGVVKNRIVLKKFIDKEHSHVFLYKSNNLMEECQLQQEEVTGLVKAEFDAFYDLWLGEAAELNVEGFILNERSEKIPYQKTVGRSSFVPHEESYFQTVLQTIKGTL